MATVRNDIEKDDNALFREYREKPTRENRNKIVNKYLYLPEIISKKFLNRGLDYEDIYQVGCVGLIKAVERFDPEKGVKFVSFATPTILGEIKRYFRDKVSMIRIPRRIYEIYQKVNHAREHLTFKLQRPPKVDEIAEFLNISEETVLEITEAWGLYNMQSFDQGVYDDSDLEFYETIGKEDTTFEKIENKDFLEKSMNMFNDLEKEFIRMRYHDNKTQKAIADKLGVSQMYVSRMERKILQKFRRIINK